MKSKKIAIALVALTMSATSALAFTACSNKHTEHDYTWTTTTAATCTAEGEKKGVCSCGDETTEKIPALNHNYGDWAVTAPTAEATGTAKKVCANDTAHEHDITVTLPKLGDESYKVTEGKTEDTYKYTDATHGDITFKVANPKGDPVEIKFTTTADDYNADSEFYAVELQAVKPTATGKYDVSIQTAAKVDLLEVYESKEAYDNWEPAILSNSELGVGLTNKLTLSKDKEYKLYVVVAYAAANGDAMGEFTLSATPSKRVDYASASFGDNTVTVEKDKDVLFAVGGLSSGKRYVLKFAEGTLNDPEAFGVKKVNVYEYTKQGETSFEGGNYLVLSVSSGYLRFGINASVAGEYKFTISEFVAVPATGIEVKDTEGKEVTEYTLYANMEDTDLLSYIKVLPSNATDKGFYLAVEDTTVATVTTGHSDSLMQDGAFLKGVKVGTTKLIITAKDNQEIKKEITLHVAIEATAIQVGDSVFDYESDLGALEGAGAYYQFTGTANTEYIVTFTAGTTNYGWTIKDASDEDNNYFSKTDKRVKYIKVTTDAEGKATLLVIGNGTGTMSIVLETEFEYPDDGGNDGPSKDLDGRYVLSAGDNEGYDFAAEEELVFVFTGDANTDYTVKINYTPKTIGQCGSTDAWLVAEGENKSYVENTEEDWGGVMMFTTYLNSYTVTTDATGKAYVKIAAGSNPISEATISVKKGKVDENGYVIITAGENTGLSISDSIPSTFTFKGEANSEYSVTLSEIAHYFGQIDSWGDYIESLKITNVDQETFEVTGTTTTCTINTNADGVAYLKISSTDGIGDLTITVTYVGEAQGSGGEAAIPTVTANPETGSCTITVSEGDYTDPVTYNYVVEISFTPETTSTYNIAVTDADGFTTDVYSSLEAMNDGMSIYSGQQLVAGTEYKFYISVFMEGNYTFTATAE